MVAQTASLSGTTAGVVLRIEVKHQLPTFIITQTDIPSLFILAQNLGRLVSNVYVNSFLGLLFYQDSLSSIQKQIKTTSIRLHLLIERQWVGT